MTERPFNHGWRGVFRMNARSTLREFSQVRGSGTLPCPDPSRPAGPVSIRGLPILVCAGLALVGAAVLFWFEPTQHAFYPICAFHRTTGLLCPGCGSLRALHQLLHGQVAAAFHF